ncbi:hypothetical protein ACFXTH_034503 [Malus domestica]
MIAVDTSPACLSLYSEMVFHTPSFEAERNIDTIVRFKNRKRRPYNVVLGTISSWDATLGFKVVDTTTAIIET